MKQRYCNENNKHYCYYGGRGIQVCDNWAKSFENFLNDMGECPEGYSIERLDCNGNYEPSNCIWLFRTEQWKNRRIGGDEIAKARYSHLPSRQP